MKDKLDKLHEMLAKSNIDSKSYKKMSLLIIEIKQDLTKSDSMEHCEYYQSDQCSCFGYCQG